MGAGGLVQNDTESLRRVNPARASLPSVSRENLVWEDRETFAAAAPTPALVQFAIDALRAEKLELVGALTLARHRPGDHGLPAGSEPAACRFAIDLTDSRSSVEGGVLLFLDDAGRGPGWRAEAGAMTVWSGPDPVLTELVSGAPERLTLVGQARPPFPE